LSDIETDQVDVVLAWHTDRLHRSPVELEMYIATCEAHDVSTVTVRAGELDLASAAGRMVARMLGAAARHESEQRGERVRRAREQEARTGRVHSHLGYGWRKLPGPQDAPRWVIHDQEADVIREIAARLLAGDTLTGIAKDLNARRVPTPAGLVGRWRAPNIRSMVVSGRYCGWREWTPSRWEGKSRIQGRGFGVLVAKGDWPAILTRETTEQLRLVLGAAERNTGGGRPARATYLLSAGLARCGRCGGPLTGHSGGDRFGRRYVCSKQPGLARCGRLTITAGALDALVTEAILTAIADIETGPTNDDAARREEELLDQITRLRLQLDDLATLYVEGHITQREWLTARSTVDTKIKEQEARVKSRPRRLVLDGLPTELAALRAAWASMPLHQQRALAATVLRHVVVQPAQRGGNRLNPERIELIWRA
jgi:hypothetical protein